MKATTVLRKNLPKGNLTVAELTAYAGEDGQLWFRPRAMFEDGRFTREEGDA